MLPAEPVVESMNVTIPKTEKAVSKAVLGKGGYRLIVADEEYVRFARKMVVASACSDCWSGGSCLCGGEEVNNYLL